MTRIIIGKIVGSSRICAKTCVAQITLFPFVFFKEIVQILVGFIKVSSHENYLETVNSQNSQDLIPEKILIFESRKPSHCLAL